MTIDIPIRNTDDMSTVYATNTVVFDAPIHDDMEGVIDDYNSPYEQGIPIEVIIPPEIKPERKSKKKLMDELFSYFNRAEAEQKPKLDE